MSSAAEPMKKVKLSEILGGLDDVKERLKIIEASVKDTETGRTWQETTKTTMKELEGLKKTIENQSKQLTEVVAENKNLRKKVEVLQKNLDDIRNENPSTTSGESSDESDRDDALLKSEVKKAEASEVAYKDINMKVRDIYNRRPTKMLMACISGTDKICILSSARSLKEDVVKERTLVSRQQ